MYHTYLTYHIPFYAMFYIFAKKLWIGCDPFNTVPYQLAQYLFGTVSMND